MTTAIHGHHIQANFGYTYPLFSRIFEHLNAPLVDLVKRTYLAKKRPLVLIDVGAAIGDTILLIEQRCPENVQEFHAVEGDPDFYTYCKKNLTHLKNKHLYHRLLSSKEGFVPALVRTHEGTASAQGDLKIQAVTLDSIILESAVQSVDILKIDVDGFDGRVLSGSQEILKKFQPAIIFEWHPGLCRKTGNDFKEPFHILMNHCYNQFFWFDKYGNFSHKTDGITDVEIDEAANLCLIRKRKEDWHYDIVALHESSDIVVTTERIE